MKKKHITILVSLFLLIILSNVNVVRSEPTAQASTPQTATIGEIKTEATQDTTVHSGYPNANFGDWITTQCGWMDGNEFVSYYFFPFTDKPAEYTNVYLDFEIHGVFEAVDPYNIGSWVSANMSFITDSWDESTLTWNTQLIDYKDLVIFEIGMWSDGWMKLNITFLIRGLEDDYGIYLNNLSVCLYPTVPAEAEFAQLYSSEYEIVEDRPTLIWEYNIPPVVSSSGGGGGGGGGSKKKKPDDYTLFIIIGVISTIGVISVVVLYFKKFKKSRENKF